MDRATIYRRAVHALGEYEFKEGTPTEIVQEEYKAALGEACSRYAWSFTRRYACLKRVGDAVSDVFGKALYLLPTDCVKVDEYLTPEGRKVSMPEMCADGVLVPAAECPEELYISYHCDLLGDLNVLDESRTTLFVEGLVYLLASKSCMVITSNAELTARLADIAEGYFYRAIEQDVQQDWGNAKSPRALMARRIQNR